MSKPSLIRQQIWGRLHDVARPDTRFHLNFAEVIPDFEGSEAATERVAALPACRDTRFAFITPDNCLVGLRRRLIAEGKPFVMSTYGIYRGFLLMEPGMVPPGAELYAAWLDGMEHFARPITLAEIAGRGRFDFMVTGASAASVDGVRFGKGHGFFDLEWGMFTDLGLADEATPVAAVVHDFLTHYSIGQVWNVIFYVLKDMAALAQEKTYARQHVYNMIPGNLRRYFDYRLGNNKAIRPWQRPAPLTESWMSSILFDKVLGDGNTSFEMLTGQSVGAHVEFPRRFPEY